jgi:RHS repeat-associated protein
VVTWPTSGTTQVSPAAGLTADARPGGVSPGAVRAGALPIWVGPAKSGRTIGGNVSIHVADRPATQRAGVSGLLLSVGSADPVTLAVDYSGFRNAYGGDWATRLRLETLPACALTTPVRSDCQRGTPLATTNNTTAHILSANVPANAVVAADAGAAGASGTYQATTLSSSGKWNVSTQSGDFTWQYPLDLPPVATGLEPDLGLSYSANAIDGHTAATNNQSSWVGDGWTLSPGYIERGYKSCATEDVPIANRTADQCWGGDNATISLSGMSTELILDGGTGNTWRAKNDDGIRAERFFDTSINDSDDSAGSDLGDNDGEYWRITKADGTQYYFGRNHLPGWASGKPSTKSTWTAPVYYRTADNNSCYKPNFADSWCRQAYRWNLDYVVDPLGNAVSYFYQPESNHYGANMAKTTMKYTRGGYLLRAEYGTRDGAALSGQAPARVVFDTADRCVPGATCTQHTPAAWPDVPWDQDCASACTKQMSPSFWSTKRLSVVTTQVLGDTGYLPVDSWTMDQIYPTPGVDSGAGLWLHGIQHSGLAGGNASVPEITFDWIGKANRVNTVGDGLTALYKPRISAVHNESGGTTSVTYLAPDCNASALPAPDANTTRCFPVRWAPKQSGPVDDWFARYVVGTLTQNELAIGGSATQTVSYSYEANGGAWAYDDNPLMEEKYRSWTDWRGYRKVTVRQGDPTQDVNSPIAQVDHLYYQGMNGDHRADGSTRKVTFTDSRSTELTDDAPLIGFERETIVRNGNDGPVVTDTINDALQRGPLATQGSHKAYLVKIAATTTRTALDAGAWRVTKTSTTYDTYGNPLTVEDLGAGAGDRCTRYFYVYNTAAWLVNMANAQETVANSCAGPTMSSTNLIARQRSYFDDQAFGVAPVRGKTTKIEEVTAISGSTPVYGQHSRSTFDDFGRVTASFDARDKETDTAYTDAHGLNTTTTVTNPVGFVAKTSVETFRGMPTRTVDQNNLVTTLRYDPLGRLVEVDKPGPTGATAKYTYTMRNDAVSSVRTDELRAGGSYVTSYLLLDGFLRPRQTQTPAFGGGVVLTDKFYDSRGLVVKTNDTLAVSGTPGSTLLLTNDGAVPAQTLTTFDGVARATASTLVSKNTVVSRTTTSYHGDHVDVTPLSGGTATTTYTDARGQRTELRQYRGPTPTGAYDATVYRYTPAGQMAGYTDAAGSVWSFEFNLHGDRIAETSPDKGRTTMTYDAAGNPRSATDARNTTVTYDYDDMGRRIDIKSGTSLLASWTYDTLFKGLLTSSTRYVGSNAYTTEVTSVDAVGRPTNTNIIIPASEGGLAGTYSGGASYYPDGALQTADLPALGDDLPAERMTYTYNAFGLPLTTTSPRANYVSDTIYTSFMEPSQVQYGGPNDPMYWSEQTYDVATRRPVQSTVEKSTGTPVVNTVTYGYDPAGNVKSIDERAGGTTTHDAQCMDYDYLRRLTEAWAQGGACAATPSAAALGGPAPYWQSYTYDVAGNRLTKTAHSTTTGTSDTVETLTYPAATGAAPHAVRTRTVTGPNGTRTDNYQYDAVGDTVSRPGTSGAQTLTWDVEQHLTTVDDNTYRYSADGALLISTDANGTTLYLPGGQVHVDTTGRKTGTRFYTHGTHPIAVRTAAGLKYEFGDLNGSTTLAIDAVNPDKLVRRRFDLFGLSRDTAAVAWPDNHSFVGGIADPAAGLTRLGARDYDASLGRFISVDPILDPAQPQQNNGYAYGWNNPATMPDPAGTFPPSCNVAGDCMAGKRGDPQPVVPQPGTVRPSCDDNCRVGVRGPGSPPKSTAQPIRPSCGIDGNCRVGVKGPSDAELRRRDLQEKTRQFLAQVGRIAAASGMPRMVELAKLLVPELLKVSSGSLCLTGSAGQGLLGVAVEGCLNMDAKGATLSWATSANIGPGHVGESASVLLRANFNNTADSIGTGWSLSYDWPEAVLGARISVQNHTSIGTSNINYPGLPFGPGDAFEIKASIGGEVAPLGTLSFSTDRWPSGNTGYHDPPHPHHCWCMGANMDF